MKYGAGSALASDVMARSSSCCRILIRTGSPAWLELLCWENAGMEKMARNSQTNKYLGDDMIRFSLPEPLVTANVTLGSASNVGVNKRSFTVYAGFRSVKPLRITAPALSGYVTRYQRRLDVDVMKPTRLLPGPCQVSSAKSVYVLRRFHPVAKSWWYAEHV